MIGRRTTICLALLCALAFCTFAAQSAIAQVGTPSINTTAVTCVAEPKNLGDFEDSHCDKAHPSKKGAFTHEAIAKDTTTELEVSQEGTSKLNTTLAGVVTEVTCKKATSVTAANKSFIHNVEISGKHTVTGTVQMNLTECTVVKPSKCIVKEPIVATAEVHGVEGLNGKNEMGFEFKGEGDESTIAETFFENNGAEKCAIGGLATPWLMLRGSMIATGKAASGNKQHGATWVFEDANEMETLDFSGKNTSFAATFTTRMSGGGNPISLTTVT
jgi:hypothetical protein